MTREDYRKLLLKRIGESRLSQRQFAALVVHRDERTVRRWVSGESPVPRCIHRFLETPVPAPWPTGNGQG
jgi:hypothetical protein